MKKQKKLKIIMNSSLVVAFILVLLYLTIRYASVITELISDPDKFKQLLASYGYASALVFILFQIFQVIITLIPGEVVQIAGGYVYGTVLGTLYSVIGIFIGSIIVFYFSRLIGYPLVKLFVSHKSLEKFNFLINSEKSEVVMFFLFLLPALPKDILVYIAGLMPIKPLKFFLIFGIARFPALLGSSFIGANLYEKDYFFVVIVSLITIVLFVGGLLAKNKILKKLNKV